MKLAKMALAALLTGILLSASGGAAFAQTGECEDFVITDNGEFSIEFLGATENAGILRFEYEVCRLAESPASLSHWSIQLDQLNECLSEECTPAEFVVACYQTAPYDPENEMPGDYIPEGAMDDNAPVCILGEDQQTGVIGLKFNNLAGFDVGYCQRYAFELDLGCLADGETIGIGEVTVSTKAGNQDIRDPDPPNDVPDPGFAVICGPVCGGDEPPPPPGDCEEYAETDNGEFSIELLPYKYDPKTNQLYLFYEVCNIGEGEALDHWVIQLDQFANCLDANCTPEQFVPLCAQTAPYEPGAVIGLKDYILEGANNPNAPVCAIVSDSATGITGLRFSNLDLAPGECQQFGFQLDLNCLQDGLHVGPGCVEVATKAGDQSSTNEVVDPPGYAEIIGPVCIEHHPMPE